MSDLLIRGLSPHAVARLKHQASAHGRSMQSEAKAILESGIRPTVDEWLARVDSTRARMEEEHGVLPDSSAMLVEELRNEREG